MKGNNVSPVNQKSQTHSAGSGTSYRKCSQKGLAFLFSVSELNSTQVTYYEAIYCKV